GYGIRAYLIVQDLAQLAQTYGRDESIISNCHVRVAYTANKVETAKVISEMAGTMTVHREARTYTGNRLSPVLLHVMASEQELQRPLLTPDEVMRLPDDAALIFVAGRRPIYGRRIRYYEDPVFADRASVPPPVESDRLAHDWGTWPEPAGPGRTGPAAVGTSDHSDEAAAAASTSRCGRRWRPRSRRRDARASPAQGSSTHSSRAPRLGWSGRSRHARRLSVWSARMSTSSSRCWIAWRSFTSSTRQKSRGH